MKLKPKFRYFLWFVAALLLTNILVLGDLLTVWSPAETQLIAHSQLADDFHLPTLVGQLLYDAFGFQLLFLRFPSVVLFLFALGAIFSLGKRLFGERTILLTILVLGSSLLLPNLAKIATSDLWLFSSVAIGSLSIMLYLKQPVNTWRYWIWASTVLAFWIDPLAAFLWSQCLWISLYFLHPQGKNLKGAYLWAFVPLLGLYWALGPADTSLIRWNAWAYLAQITAFLPWIPLLVGGLVDVGVKFRKREEMSTLIVVILLAGLVSGTLLPQLVFALIVGKQLDLYLLKNYPYRNVVKVVGILHLVAVFCAAFLGMMWGFGQLGGTGFRAGVAIGGFYWIASFMAVIGLYSPNRRMILTGMTLAGLLLTTMSWLQLGPIVESYRSLPARALQIAGAGEQSLSVRVNDPELEKLLQVYGRGNQKELVTGVDAGVVIADSVFLPEILKSMGTEPVDSMRVEGWSLPGKAHTLWVIKP